MRVKHAVFTTFILVLHLEFVASQGPVTAPAPALNRKLRAASSRRGGGVVGELTARPKTRGGPPPPLLSGFSTSTAAKPPPTTSLPTFVTEEPETDPDTFIVRLEGSAAAGPEFAAVEAELEKRAGEDALGTSFGRVRRHNNETLDQAMARVAAMPGVTYVEPAIRFRPTIAPNDPSFPSQWGMSTIGMPAVWNIAVGSSADNNGLLCIVDTGLDSSHPDLAANVPAAHKAGFNAITNALGAGEVVRDLIQHGTHCAGVAAAVGGNSIGVTGVNQKARVIGCKFIDDVLGWGDVVDAVECIDWCIAQGATVSSHSWCGKGYSQALYDAISAANMLGHLVIAAAGNDGTSNDISPTYPASYNLPNIISVAATDNYDTLASWSNYGTNAGPGTDIAAPGVNVLSTVPLGLYSVMSGTSMATPHVSGVAALIRSATGGALKNAAQVKKIILDSADGLPTLLRRVGTRGNRLNALAALQAALAAVPEPLPPLFNSTTLAVGATMPWTSGPLNMRSGLKKALPRALLASCPQGTIAATSTVTFPALFTASAVRKQAFKLTGLPIVASGTLTVDNCGMATAGRWDSIIVVMSCTAGTASGCQCWANNDGCPGSAPGGPDRVSGVPLVAEKDYYVVTMGTSAALAVGAYNLKVTVPELIASAPIVQGPITTTPPPAPVLVGTPPVRGVIPPPPPPGRSFNPPPPPPVRSFNPPPPPLGQVLRKTPPPPLTG